MITVRFENGLSIQYNTATYLTRSQAGGYTRILTKEDGALIAQVPTALCVVELIPACHIYNSCLTPMVISKGRLKQ
jgi:hypothetical protein